MEAAHRLLQAMGGEEGGGEGGREDVLDPVITLGVEHVLLIVKEPALSPRLSACTQSDFREEEEEERENEVKVAGCSLFPVSHLVTANHKADQAAKWPRCLQRRGGPRWSPTSAGHILSFCWRLLWRRTTSTLIAVLSGPWPPTSGEIVGKVGKGGNFYSKFSVCLMSVSKCALMMS